MHLTGKDAVLVWVRDRDHAAQLCRSFDRSGLASAWAASLPEAIAQLDRLFPRAVACTLERESPSLIDLETLLAYLTIGHGTISLPPIPIWALTSHPRQYAPHIERLDIPVHLVPAEMGYEGLAAEVVHALSGRARYPDLLRTGESHVLYASSDVRVGFYLSRYLTSRGMPTVAIGSTLEAMTLLENQSFHALVAEVLDEVPGRRFLNTMARRKDHLPMLIHGHADGWLARMAPGDLPRNVVGVLSHPVKAQAVESSLRRLLRVGSFQCVRHVHGVAPAHDFPPTG